MADTSDSLRFQFIKDPALGSLPVPTDIDSLSALIGRPEFACPECALPQAILLFESHVRDVLQCPSWSFFQHLMPSIAAWACQAPWAHTPLPLLTRGQAASVQLPRPQVRCLISNAFLLNITTPSSLSLPLPPASAALATPNEESFGRHNWSRVFGYQNCDISPQKILCLLTYFYHWTTQPQGSDDPDRGPGIVIERLQLTPLTPSPAGASDPDTGAAAVPAPQGKLPGSWEQWSTCTAPISSSMVRVHTRSMESSHARAFVDFANRFVGYHSIIPSMTQEEILWCTVPEAQPAALLCEAMASDEAVVVRNVQRLSAYTGYLDTFTWRGFWAGPEPGSGPGQPGSDAGPGQAGGTTGTELDVLVMDAMVVRGKGAQFQPPAMARDLTKAWLCFQACRGGPEGGSGGPEGGPADGGAGTDPAGISSGNWGCGVFGGHRLLKFLQQLCAVARANAARPPTQRLRLEFSTFGDEALRARLQRLLDAVGAAAAPATAGRVCALAEEFGRQMRSAGEERDEDVFCGWMVARLAAQPAAGARGPTCMVH